MFRIKRKGVYTGLLALCIAALCTLSVFAVQSTQTYSESAAAQVQTEPEKNSASAKKPASYGTLIVLTSVGVPILVALAAAVGTKRKNPESKETANNTRI